jgi:hypothetical protein
LPRVAPGPAPRPHPARASALTAPNLLSHSFSQTYGTILSNSQTNIQPSDERLLTSKTCCGFQYGCRGGTSNLSPPHFQGRSSRPGWGRRFPTLRRLAPPRCLRHFRGARTTSERKDNSSRAAGPRLRMASESRCRHMPPGAGREYSPASLLGAGMSSRICTMLAQSLRAALLGADCLDPETLLHFRLQAPPLNRCYYHQDRHQGRFHAGSRPTLPNATPAKTYLLGVSRPNSLVSARATPASAPSIFGAN